MMIDKNFVYLIIDVDTFKGLLTVNIDDKVESDALYKEEIIEVLEELLESAKGDE